VRDILLGRPPRDLDLLLEAAEDDKEESLRTLARLAGMDPVPFDRRAPVTYRLIAGGIILDVSFCPPGGIGEALERRDFTINAMAVPLPWGGSSGNGGGEILLDARTVRARLVDPLGGLADLDLKRVSSASPTALEEDPLRMLRAVRLAFTLEGFELARHLVPQIQLHAPAISGAAAERVSLELEMILASNRAGRALRQMDEMDLLSPVLPELDPLRGLAQPSSYHDHDAYEHTLRAVEQADILVEGCPEAGLPGLGEEEKVVLKWAALLHDTGKPAACTVDAVGVPHFHGHESISAEIAESTLRRLRVPSRFGEAAARLVSMHLRLGALAAARAGDRPIRRLLRAAGDRFTLLALLSLADRRAAGGTRAPQLEAALLETIRRAGLLRSEVAALAAEEPLLRGQDVMRILDIEPGPRVGSVLGWLDRLRIDGRISTREEAEAVLRSLPPPRIEG